jgi:hypothetical protein
MSTTGSREGVSGMNVVLSVTSRDKSVTDWALRLRDTHGSKVAQPRVPFGRLTPQTTSSMRSPARSG